MQIDVVFEETGEHIDVRFHSLLRDPDAVRSVNGIKPDENGNVTVNSTCELMQPKWGKGELEQLAKILPDGIYGFSRPMSKEIFDKLIAQCEKAVMVHRMDGTEIEVDIGKAEYTELLLGDSSEPEFCFILWDDNAEYAAYNLVLIGAEITPIPIEYTEFGGISAAIDHIIALQDSLIGGDGE